MSELSPTGVRLPIRSTSATRPAATASDTGERWLLVFILVEIACQITLFFLGGTPLRLPFRIGNYAFSLALLVLMQGRGRPHPAARLVPFIAAVFCIEWLNPSGDRLIAAVAQTCLYLAVLAPLVWVGQVTVRWPAFRRVLILLWLFHTSNAVLGVLQVQYPGRFSGSLSENYDRVSIQPHIFVLADGSKIIRPTGLTDTPGGAAAGGVYAIVLGMGLLVTERGTLFRVAVPAAMCCGLFCIYICQGRTNLIIVAVAALVLLATLSRRRMFARASALGGAIAAVVVIGSAAAFAAGGQAVIDRFATLVADDPQNVFARNRGAFLGQMGDDAVAFALGAGMGRWGMMSFYFGGSVPSLWAEIMWQALLYDGGWPVVILYAGVLLLLLRWAWTVALRTRHDALVCWAGVICGYNIAAIAATFVFPIFSLSMGMEVIFLNACLYGCYRHEADGRAVR